MQSLYLPQSLAQEIATLEIEQNGKRKKLLPACQLVLYVLLQHSNASYKPVRPSIPEISRLSGIKSHTTIRTCTRQLELAGVLFVKKTYTKTKRGDMLTHNNYYFTFKPWIDRDKANGLAGDADGVEQMVALAADRAARAAAREENKNVNRRIDKIEFNQQSMQSVIDNLPAALKPWLNHMTYHATHGRTLYFKQGANEAVSRSFVEEEFAKHGISIQVLSA